MAHFAQLDEASLVIHVVVIANEEVPDEVTGIAFCKSLFGTDTTWIKTSYNNNIRKRYASIGMTYDPAHDAFIPKKPFESWVLNSDLNWVSPVPKPDDGKPYKWNEANQQWDERIKLTQ